MVLRRKRFFDTNELLGMLKKADIAAVIPRLKAEKMRKVFTRRAVLIKKHLAVYILRAISNIILSGTDRCMAVKVPPTFAGALKKRQAIGKSYGCWNTKYTQ
jgi:hypothetical protein